MTLEGALFGLAAGAAFLLLCHIPDVIGWYFDRKDEKRNLNDR